MTIPNELLTHWKALRSYGDGTKIRALLPKGTSNAIIHRVFKTGRCTEQVFDVMGKFYTERAARINIHLPKENGVSKGNGVQEQLVEQQS